MQNLLPHFINNIRVLWQDIYYWQFMFQHIYRFHLPHFRPLMLYPFNSYQLFVLPNELIAQEQNLQNDNTNVCPNVIYFYNHRNSNNIENYYQKQIKKTSHILKALKVKPYRQQSPYFIWLHKIGDCCQLIISNPTTSSII